MTSPRPAARAASAATAECASTCTARPQRPRLAVYRSNKHISAQVIDDERGHTLAAASSTEADLRAAGTGGSVAAAERVGALVAERAKAAGVTAVVFDRGGYAYHGRVAAIAEAARNGGLDF